MPDPLVSVLTLTYNQNQCVTDALQSAVDQDYPNLQVVVGDDGSTDGTDEIVRDFARKYPDRVVALVGGPRLGVTANSNRTLRACQGKYVAHHAGDDLLLPGKIRVQVEWMEEDAARVICGHDVDVFDAATGATRFIARATASGAGASAIVQNGYLFTTQSIMTRRAATPARGYDERLRIGSDWQFFIECLVHGGRYGFVPGVLSRYRRKGSSLSEEWATDPECRRVWTEDNLVTLAWVELNHPQYSRSCRIRRAVLLRDYGIAALNAGRISEARRHFVNALRNHVTPKSMLWLATAGMPAPLRTPLAAAFTPPPMM